LKFNTFTKKCKKLHKNLCKRTIYEYLCELFSQLPYCLGVLFALLNSRTISCIARATKNHLQRKTTYNEKPPTTKNHLQLYEKSAGGLVFDERSLMFSH